MRNEEGRGVTLFTKNDCRKCDNIKAAFDLGKLGIEVTTITEDDAETLAALAWYELVDLVDQGALPILVLNDGSHIKYELPIRRFLEQHAMAN
jgi:glutaredoxin